MFNIGNKYLDRAEYILEYWFGVESSRDYTQPRPWWFSSRITTASLRREFELDLTRATRGRYAAWEKAPLPALALIIILSQFPRLLFPGDSGSYSSNYQAIQIAKKFIELDYHLLLSPVQQWFVYLPFQYSENVDDQLESIELFGNLGEDLHSQNMIQEAMQTSMLIQYFGRFPDRNAILGRESTSTEIQFLQQSQAANSNLKTIAEL